ncbi:MULTISPECIES: hypothetical protein [unclassified Pseudomonas]|uniref:hypothetical protein n=1 Tax=unclassified Pseudomonas TaxID=196821 RepID=UPI000C888221|nr:MULTISPECIES: hypothetical protein [unclassified Pseudomonas]PMZ97113.1 hypothetical protein C1X79_11510 [Pseudomonas sp. FW305-42]PNA27212.1 hypothetical protein C1X78_03550 [Pseudomonas sp. MPR-R1B]PNB26924.1 hypothetical protein C1X80_08915 [Pseudomonas sp. DP16D-E2]PNB44067.1 hypothetical protein C1X75_07995 [Pseudomonas sp. FW305-17]PNB64666.1 hypothetical protein C1X77_00300 [Pseudomonas sp. GW531-E2]
MKIPAPCMLLVGLFALAAAGSASAAPMKTVAPAAQVLDAANHPAAANPWPSLASAPSAPLLAHDDRYRHDERWHDHRDDWRREQWRREQWRREQHRRAMERQRYWDRHHDRALHHRYDDDRRYYRR